MDPLEYMPALHGTQRAPVGSGSNPGEHNWQDDCTALGTWPDGQKSHENIQPLEY